MKTALFHDYLNQYGGAERVLEVLAEMFPEAPIFTLFYDENKTLGRFKGRVKKTSFLDFSLACGHHRAFIPLMPWASDSLRTEKDFDLIISSSAGYAKGFDAGRVPHICYCHTPLRYAWEKDYLRLKTQNLRLKTLADFVINPIVVYLKNWDYRAGQKPDVLIANSNFIAQKIQKYYGRQAEVIYPPVDFEIFHYESSIPKKDYFLMVGRLMHYKKFDLGIEVFNQLHLPLKIAGRGPEEKRLKKLIKSPLIELCGFVEEEDLRRMYNEARALVFPQVEDFGLAAAEAQACGLPVIAFRKGGSEEIVLERKTGLFFEEQEAEALRQAIEKLQELSEREAFDPIFISNSARRFSKENFKENIWRIIDSNKLL